MDKEQPAFIIDPTPVPWPVVVEGIPAPGGTFAAFQFTAHIRVLAEHEYEDILAEAKEPAPEQSAREMLIENARLLPRLVSGWEGVVDGAKQAVAFSPEVLAAQLTGRYGRQLGAGLWRAVNEVRYGVRLGNSASAPAAGSVSAEPPAPTSSSPT